MANGPDGSATMAGEADGAVEGTRIVIISSFTDPDDIRPFQQAVVAQLADLGIGVDFHHVSTVPAQVSEQDALASALMGGRDVPVAFIIRSDESPVALRILTSTAKGLQSTGRTVDVAPGAPRHEALAVIVRAATVSAVERTRRATGVEADAALPRDPRPRPAPKPVATERRSEAADRQLSVSAGFFAGLYAARAPGIGLAIGLRWKPVRRVTIHLGYDAFSTVAKRVHDVALRLHRHPLRVGVGYGIPLSGWTVGGSLLLEVDYVVEEKTSENRNWTLYPDGAEVHAAVRACVYAEYRIRPWLGVFLELSGDVPLVSTEYRLGALDGEEVILGLLPIQPGLTAGLRALFF